MCSNLELFSNRFSLNLKINQKFTYKPIILMQKYLFCKGIMLEINIHFYVSDLQHSKA